MSQLRTCACLAVALLLTGCTAAGAAEHPVSGHAAGNQARAAGHVTGRLLIEGGPSVAADSAGRAAHFGTVHFAAAWHRRSRSGRDLRDVLGLAAARPLPRNPPFPGLEPSPAREDRGTDLLTAVVGDRQRPAHRDHRSHLHRPLSPNAGVPRVGCVRPRSRLRDRGAAGSYVLPPPRCPCAPSSRSPQECASVPFARKIRLTRKIRAAIVAQIIRISHILRIHFQCFDMLVNYGTGEVPGPGAGWPGQGRGGRARGGVAGPGAGWPGQGRGGRARGEAPSPGSGCHRVRCASGQVGGPILSVTRVRLSTLRRGRVPGPCSRRRPDPRGPSPGPPRPSVGPRTPRPCGPRRTGPG